MDTSETKLNLKDNGSQHPSNTHSVRPSHIPHDDQAQPILRKRGRPPKKSFDNPLSSKDHKSSNFSENRDCGTSSKNEEQPLKRQRMSSTRARSQDDLDLVNEKETQIDYPKQRLSNISGIEANLKKDYQRQISQICKNELKIVSEEANDTSNCQKKMKNKNFEPRPRRSTRIENQDENSRPMYCLDKLSLGAYQATMIHRDMKKTEEQLIKYAIQRSLIEETKYKTSKEFAENNPVQWYKNFMKEQCAQIPEIDLIKADQGLQIEQKKKNDILQDDQCQEQSKLLPFKKRDQKNLDKTKSKQKNTLNLESDSDSQDSVQSVSKNRFDQEVNKEKFPNLLKNIKSRTFLTKISEIKDNQFLEPLPVTKKKTKIDSDNQLEDENQFKLDVVNMMDIKIRKDFVPYVQFIDFTKNDGNLENEQYGPALMQKRQDKQIVEEPTASQTATEASPIKSQSFINTAATSEMSSQTFQISNSKNEKSRGHFIKLKQSHCNIKRECGVSYVKKSESKQLNVRDRGYEKLPPIVIQGSYTLPKNNNRFYEDAKLAENVNKAIQRLLFEYNPNRILVISAFESINEIQMKNYLLKPNKRLEISGGKYFLVRQNQSSDSILSELWRFVKDKFFMCIHFHYDPKEFIKTFELKENNSDSIQEIKNFIVNSDICLGFLPKKGNASVKSMLKVYNLTDHYSSHLADSSYLEDIINCQGANLQGINTIAYLGRLELYVSEYKWKNASLYIKDALSQYISNLEERMAGILLDWNKNRTIQSKRSQQDELNNDNIRLICFSKQQIYEVLNDKAKEQTKWDDLDSNFPVSLEIDIKDKPKIDLIGLTDMDSLEVINTIRKQGPIPTTLINTRDCFAYDLLYTEEVLNLGKGRENVIKKEYYYDPSIEGGYPSNLKQTMGFNSKTDMKSINNLKVGVTCYENFYSHEEMNELEKLIEKTEEKSFNNEFLPMTAQKTMTGVTLKRTKFFFGYRYMWTKTQLQDPLANVAAGVRADVSQPPVWMKTKLEEPLVQGKIIEKNFVNSVALNVYHDGSEGLAQHFDDATRFKQPIYTLRLFSDSRLSFGCQYYGFQNGAFTIPLPRGCICKMEEASYSANGVKHCIRPCDMTGKSSAVILRQMHPNVVEEANKLDRNIDLPMWFSTLSINENAIPFYVQKEKECEFLEHGAIPSCGSLKKYTEQNQKGIDKYPGLYQSQYTSNDKPKSGIHGLLNDLINRVEAKLFQENEITQKLSKMRHKLQVQAQCNSDSQESSDNSNQLVKLFKTEKIKHEVSSLDTDESDKNKL